MEHSRNSPASRDATSPTSSEDDPEAMAADLIAATVHLATMETAANHAQQTLIRLKAEWRQLDRDYEKLLEKDKNEPIGVIKSQQSGGGKGSSASG